MNLSARYIYIVPALALLALIALFFISSGNIAAAPCTPSPVNWDITDQVNCNGLVPVSANIHVKNGGTLNLSVATLRMDGTYNGQYTIDVLMGGALDVVSGSNITAGNPLYHYKFIVRSGASLLIRDSGVSYAGYSMANDDTMGLRVDTSSATISRSAFKNDYIGLFVNASSPKVDNTTFQNDLYGALIRGPSKLGFYDNLVQLNTKGIYIIGARPDIVKNRIFWNTEDGIYLERSDANIYGNRLLYNYYGISGLASSPGIRHNNISKNIDGIRAFFGDPAVENNEIWNNSRDSIFMTETGGWITNNAITGDPLQVTNDLTMYGVHLMAARTSVKNNTILYPIYGIFADADCDIEVMDNTLLYSGTGLKVLTSRADMVHNNISGTYYLGVELTTVTGLFGGNTVHGNPIGLDVFKSNASLRIIGNTFTDNPKSGLSLSEASAWIQGNTIVRSKRAIACNRSVPTVVGNTIRNSEFGVEIGGYSDLYFAGNTVMDGNYTIYSIKSRSTIYNNTVTNSWNYSIWLCLGSYALIEDNVMTGGGAKGVYIMNSNADIKGNTFQGSGVGVFATFANLTLSGNTVHDVSVGYIFNRTTATISGDDLHDITDFGIDVSETTIHVSDLPMANVKIAYYITASRAWLDNVSMSSGTKGVWTSFGSTVSISRSTISDNAEEGVYIFDSTVRISDSFLSNNKYGIRAFRTTVTATRTTFYLGEEGIRIDGTGANWKKLALDGCVFFRIKYTGVNAYETDITVTDTIFTLNGNGLLMENGTLTVTDSHVLENTDIGIRVNGTRVVVRDTSFIGNMDGLFDQGGSALDIIDCNMSSNEVYGLYTDDSTLYSNITITKRVIMQDNILLIRGLLDVREDGHLQLLRAPLEMYSVKAGEAGILVETGGSFEMVEALIYAHIPGSGYTFVAEPNSGLTIINSTIRHCGIGVPAPRDGLVVRTKYSDLRDTLFENNSIGLHVDGTELNATGLRFKDDRVSLLAELSTVYLVNSTFTGSKEKDVSVSFSTVKILNTKLTFSKVEVLDKGSIFVVMWYLHVSVTWNDGQPIYGAGVTVTDKALYTLSTSTDSQGYVRWLIVREYQQQGPDISGYFAFAPLTINASDHLIHAVRSEYVSSTMTIYIVLTDKTPPKIVVTTPLNNSVAYDSDILVIGTATDDSSGAIFVEVSVDGVSWVPATGSTSWSAPVGVTEGMHNILVRAKDARGNIGMTSIMIEVDLSSPMLEVLAPDDGLVTNASSVRVQGKVHLGSGLIVNGMTVTISMNGTFEQTVSLSEGQNVIHVKAIRNLLTAEKNITVFRDTRPPSISLKHPLPGTVQNSTYVTITVASDEEASFNIAGQAVDTFGGVADLGLDLQEGPNTIHVKAVDKAGNVNEKDFTIIIDVTRPALSLIKPQTPVFKTSKNTLDIEGSTEPGANLTIDGKGVPVGADGKFALKQKLVLGQNDIHIIARDKAGNTNEIILSVKRIQTVDMGKYYLLIAVALILAIVANAGVFVYFQRYYRPKPPGTAVGDAGTAQKGMEPQRKEPRRPPTGRSPDGPGNVEETEFEEVSFEELPPD